MVKLEKQLSGHYMYKYALIDFAKKVRGVIKLTF